ncbi:helix-hairpin-helix domain-containing protein [Alcaligenaceae bacterium]|nr:helix-hairpin-helix domain-containing protein [Alcaligenaceae bacterium]
MNPFTESTVAVPVKDSPAVQKRRGLSPLPTAWLLAGSLVTGALMLPNLAHATDVNLANVDQLKVVRGIGPKTASLIIEERTRGGPYESFSDLSDRVKGIGPKKASALQQAGLTVGEPSPDKTNATMASPAHSKRGG